ncbi:flavin reductase family protein (plasmid) [Paraburkholderia sprentiae WSM5005]|uniref:Flavin reductase family protein n=2 Tax=Paraburkholderia sprentiae TaxID=948107 RepID=A0A8F4QID4_9BURK|nr:flavin reductase family protein [Paraburkholderia sprentiae WSM5005]
MPSCSTPEVCNATSTSMWSNAEPEPRALRKLFGTYPTGVAIVTTRTPERRSVGLTINSFATLSLEPPLILWSLDNHSPNLAAFRHCSHFAINFLSCDHEHLARRFASSGVADKFIDVALIEAPECVPVIDGAIATLVCAHDDCRDAGDHLLFVGRVVRTASRDGAPLVFHAGRFTSLENAL